MALIISGERSGVGKTTVTLALLACLRRRSLKVQSFKVGPDYIDPMFHQYVTGRPCRNLDPVLTSEAYVQDCFARHSQDAEFALVEGVMGLFDGVEEFPWLQKGRGSPGAEEQRSRGAEGLISHSPTPPLPHSSFASTAHIARLLDLPVLLVMDCSRLSGSVAAIAHGYRSLDPSIQLAGVVLNRVGSDRHLELLKDALEPLQMPILGVLRRQDDITIPDRHLGLVPTEELTQLDTLINRLAQLGETCFNWERLLPLLETTLPLHSPTPPLPHSPTPIRLAVARDRAFNFYYADNLDLLEQLGAELVPWSPLQDSELPEGIQAMYFGGGFPEVFAQQLAENRPARNAVRAAILTGMPTYAECGGLMYLCEQLVDFEGKAWSMVGILPTTAVMSSSLTLGYRQAVALQDSPLLPKGAIVQGHEFHRSRLSEMPKKPLFQVQRYSSRSDVAAEGWQLHRVHASYIHLHWGAHPQLAQRLVTVASSNLAWIG